MEVLADTALHGGRHLVIKHDSTHSRCAMEFALFIPPNTDKKSMACLYYLSGLTCTWENAATKAGAQAYAAKKNLVLVFPDTSPRGAEVADDEAISLGQGAGFYMTALDEPWAPHYAMDSYITEELPSLVNQFAEIDEKRVGIMGHSMGGHGALTLAMKHPEKYQSLSAFAPISSLMASPWGQIALDSYRGSDSESFPHYDASECMKIYGWEKDILVDQGAGDPFLKEHLRSDLLASAATEAKIDLQLRMHKGYDHSYWFVSSFIEDHIEWHRERLS